MTTLKSLHANLEVLEAQLIEAQQNLESAESIRDAIEIDVDEFEEEYKNSLDECNGEFMGYSASRILEELDPTAFRCGLNDYCDSKDVEDTQEWVEANEKVESVESEIEDLESSIEDLEEEIAELEEE
ncbi:coil containing protein [Vibrio phage 1.063.O._10N.261.45.C7]|nr:coil containing protein [Vibrio phage 1.063.O._10N.261.45.C7]